MPRLPALPSPPRAGMDPNRPEPGYWLVRLVRNGPILPASITRIDHEPGDPDNTLDTGPILIANIGFEDIEPRTVWTARRVRSLTPAEYGLEIDKLAWDRKYDPLSPQAAAPRERVNLAERPAIGPKP